MNTSEQIQALKEGRIDVGFGRLRISDPAVKRVLLREERLMVAAHSSHFLLQRDGVNLTELVDQPLFYTRIMVRLIFLPRCAVYFPSMD